MQPHEQVRLNRRLTRGERFARAQRIARRAATPKVDRRIEFPVFEDVFPLFSPAMFFTRPRRRR